MLIKRYGIDYQLINNARNVVGINGAGDITQKNLYNMPVQFSQSADNTINIQVTDNPTPLQVEDRPTLHNNPLITYMPMYSIPQFSSIYEDWVSNSKLGNRKKFVITNENIIFNDEESLLRDIHIQMNMPPFLTLNTIENENIGANNLNPEFLNLNEAEFYLEMSFAGLDTVAIQSGPWFDISLVTKYKDHLDPERSRGLNFFGPNGALLMIPTKLILGFQPEIILNLGSYNYKKVENHLKKGSAAIINIGSICISNNENASENTLNKINFDDERSRLVINGKNSQIPILLGVVSRRLGAST